MVLPQSFYNQKTLKVAQQLLGCYLCRKINNKIYKYKITETEAYCGFKDKASHASKGKTERNKVMFGPPGHIYIYLVYGMHYMLNIVTEKEGYPAAVLIRGIEGFNGPAKLTKKLKIDKKFNGLPIFDKKNNLWLARQSFNENGIEANKKIKPIKIKKSTRIGIDYAEEYKDKLWRFSIK